MRTMLLLCSCLTIAACTSDDTTPPTISNLTFSPNALPVGQQTTINGTIGFADPDGDLDQLGVEITLPDQSKQALPMTDLQNVGTMTDGTIAWALIIAPPAAGAYHLSLWITDVDGHASNHLEANATAQ
ncbi:MAG TPA: hypothetical protein VIV40_09410 [Kofleriaceae bacterium]